MRCQATVDSGRQEERTFARRGRWICRQEELSLGSVGNDQQSIEPDIVDIHTMAGVAT